MFDKLTNNIWKGKAILICFFLFAACMTEDEGHSPDIAHHDDGLPEPGPIIDNGSVAAVKKKTFTAHLNSSNEVPANDSQGQGQVIFKLSDDGTTLHYKLIVANIENVTQAHIHCGEAGVNGPVVVFLFGFNSAGVTQNGVLSEGTITSANIIPRPSSTACLGGLATFAKLLERMQNGSVYVNVHTLAKPGGEIRGQIK